MGLIVSGLTRLLTDVICQEPPWRLGKGLESLEIPPFASLENSLFLFRVAADMARRLLQEGGIAIN